MVILVASAVAAPVVCDPDEAERVLVDARIDELRAPVTHPWLVPGLARRTGDPAVSEEVARLCAGKGNLFVERAEVYEQSGWSAHLLVLSRIELDGDCSLVHHRVPLSVGIGPSGATYRVRGELPPERTPMGACAAPAVWRQERIVAGGDEAVRLVLVIDHAGDEVVHTHVAVRQATPGGWSDQVLLDPAPPRLLDPTAAGPEVGLARARNGDPVVVVTHARTDSPCRAVGGQEVWRSTDQGWTSVTGREALTVLAREGLWRLAGDAGYLLILGQDNERDADLVEPRRRRLQRRDPEPLYLMSSSDFPGLNPGFVMITPAPWATAAEAEVAKSRWTRSASAYVKRAWIAPDPCATSVKSRTGREEQR